MAFAKNTATLWVSIYGVMPVAQGFISTMVVVGVKRYANPAGRSFAYGLFCSSKNVAILFTGVLYDVFRRSLVNGLKLDAWGSDSPLNDGMRLYLLVAGICTSCAFGLALFLDENAHVDDGGNADARLEIQAGNRGSYCGKILKFLKDLKDLWSITLLKYMIVCALTVNLRLLMDHVEATFPKYQIRAFGCDAPVGLTYSINPLVMIFMVPVIQAMLTRVNRYDVIHLGSYITAFSPFLLVLFQTKWASAMFVAVLSIGEAVWSPGWFGYSMSVAPHGREAIYTGLTSAPLLVGRVLTGWLSGWLLETWCPKARACGGDDGLHHTVDPGHCHGKRVWLIVGMVILASPVGLLLGSKWLRSTGAHNGENVDDNKSAPGALNVTDEQEPLLG
ncbi:hypothetical protein BSKO_03130 [Bryopsis sp. KO-2023]|nr:hypothetical protein BSKO_03130 [Bryopsis sp. KO-2023]